MIRDDTFGSRSVLQAQAYSHMQFCSLETFYVIIQMSKRAVTGKMAGSLSARRGGGVVDDGDDKEEEEEKKEIETMETTSAYYNPK